MPSRPFKARPLLPTILTLPGLDGSGPDHWQSQWEYLLSDCHRIEMDDWSRPMRASWVERIERTFESVRGPVIFAAHSLGCLAVAWWAKLLWNAENRHKLLGAMLVAPPCVGAECATDRIVDFRPAPRQPLPFSSILVASRNDPYASFETSRSLAEHWESRLVDAGPAGHLNSDSGLGAWEHGIALLESLVTSTSDTRRAVLSRFETSKPDSEVQW